MNEEIFIHETAIVEHGCHIGAGTKVWHFSHIMGSAIIGSKCNIGQNVFIADGVVIGNNNKVQNNVSIYTGVVCEDNVFLGPSMVFTNTLHDWLLPSVILGKQFISLIFCSSKQSTS
jgi:UDP-2-acetamido-3-amino-2,3-dideoxy-glucuronate N-acetyltransferase